MIKNDSQLEREFLYYWQILASDLPELESEFRFDSKRKWRFDFVLSQYKIAIELEGAIWANGRHNRGSGFVKDIEKYNAAAVQGWCILRFTSKNMLDPATMIDTIRQAINFRTERKL